MPKINQIIASEEKFCQKIEDFCAKNFNNFGDKISHIYNPLTYAGKMYETYLQKFAQTAKQTIFLGMNPGPFGMTQTGIPFGEINAVRNWLKISAPIEKPENEHPKRPILGLEITRSEVSGKRLWGFFQNKFPKAEDFFAHNIVLNYCPLVFMSESGKNITPNFLKPFLKNELEQICDEQIMQMTELLEAQQIIGIGNYAEQAGLRAQKNFPLKSDMKIGKILHPSPASPKANENWQGYAETDLEKMGIFL